MSNTERAKSMPRNASIIANNRVLFNIIMGSSGKYTPVMLSVEVGAPFNQDSESKYG